MHPAMRAVSTVAPASRTAAAAAAPGRRAPLRASLAPKVQYAAATAARLRSGTTALPWHSETSRKARRTAALEGSPAPQSRDLCRRATPKSLQGACNRKKLAGGLNAVPETGGGGGGPHARTR